MQKILRNLAIGTAALAFSAVSAYSSDGTHWGYSGETGPQNWGSLSKDYHLCKDGESQSPVNLTQAQKGNTSSLTTHYEATPLYVVNNGHTVQANYAQGSTLQVDGEAYDLLQFHVHTPSEHTVNGHAAPLELHFVHKNAAGQLAVLGVLTKAGAEHVELAKLQANLPTMVNASYTSATTKVDATKILPENSEYYQYSGSLTTPPCSEQVKWFVYKDAVEVSADQIKAFQQIIHDNARPVQPKNARSISES